MPVPKNETKEEKTKRLALSVAKRVANRVRIEKNKKERIAKKAEKEKALAEKRKIASEKKANKPPVVKKTLATAFPTGLTKKGSVVVIPKAKTSEMLIREGIERRRLETLEKEKRLYNLLVIERKEAKRRLAKENRERRAYYLKNKEYHRVNHNGDIISKNVNGKDPRVKDPKLFYAPAIKKDYPIYENGDIKGIQEYLIYPKGVPKKKSPF